VLRAEGGDRGAVEILRKPFSRTELALALRRAIEAR
jgi:FixJ family two-component response regulator